MQGTCRKEFAVYAAFDVVVVAASAGGIQALAALMKNLPGDFPVPIVVAQHLPPASRYLSQLPAVLQRSTPLRVKWAEDAESLLPGTVYLAPQDRTTVFSPRTGRLLVSALPAHSSHNPAADPLFRSAAIAFQNRALAVVLSGVLRDGAEGSAAVSAAGGRVLAQLPSDAQFADMPRAAMNRSQVGFAFDTRALASMLIGLVMMPGVASWFGIGKAGVGVRLAAS